VNIRKDIQWNCRSELIQLNLKKLALGCKHHHQFEALHKKIHQYAILLIAVSQPNILDSGKDVPSLVGVLG
jgi:hypothetical protein